MYYNAKIKDIENKIPDVINLTINNDKINEVKQKIPKIKTWLLPILLLLLKIKYLMLVI